MKLPCNQGPLGDAHITQGTLPICLSRVGIVWDEVKDYIRNKLL